MLNIIKDTVLTHLFFVANTTIKHCILGSLINDFCSQSRTLCSCTIARKISLGLFKFYGTTFILNVIVIGWIFANVFGLAMCELVRKMLQRIIANAQFHIRLSVFRFVVDVESN